MFDDEEKTSDIERFGNAQEKEPTTTGQESAGLKEEIELLRRRVVALEDDMRIVKEKLRQMSFSPGL